MTIRTAEALVNRTKLPTDFVKKFKIGKGGGHIFATCVGAIVARIEKNIKF